MKNQLVLLDFPDVTGPHGSKSTTANLLIVRTELGLFLSPLIVTLATKAKPPPNTGQMVTHTEAWSNTDKKQPQLGVTQQANKTTPKLPFKCHGTNV